MHRKGQSEGKYERRDANTAKLEIQLHTSPLPLGASAWDGSAARLKGPSQAKSSFINSANQNGSPRK